MCLPVVLVMDAGQDGTTAPKRLVMVGEGLKPSLTFEGFSTAMKSRGIAQHGPRISLGYQPRSSGETEKAACGS